MIQRIHPVAQYLLALAVAVGGYGLYLKFAVPLIEGPPKVLRGPTQAIRPDYQPPFLKDGFDELFPADAWELKSCKIVKTAQGRILCQDWQPHDDGRVDVFPFTMVLDPKNKGDSPTIIRCMAGAQVFLDRPMTFGASSSDGGGKNKIQKARLQGQVFVYRQPSAANSSDSFHLTTTNIQIEKQQIHTIDAVEFQFGKHRGRGSNLRIELGTAEESRIASDLSTVETVDRIRLSNLDFLELHPNSRNAKKESANGMAEQTALFSGKQKPLRVACNGAFDFDLTQNLVTLEKQVKVEELGGEGDSLQCEKLELRFTGPPMAAHDQRSDSNVDLEVQSIRAIGLPAVLNVASRESLVTAAELFFDQQQGIVFANSNSSVKNISLESPAMSLVSRQVTYRLMDDQSLGDLAAKGPGHLVKKATANAGKSKVSKSFTASWERSLVVESDGPRKKIVLDGNTRIAFDETTTIESQNLKLWVWPVPSKTVGKKDDRAKTKWEYLPSELVASGKVVIDSEKVSGTARRLNGNWPAVEKTLTQLGNSNHRTSRHSSLLSMSRHWVRRPVQDWETVPKTQTVNRRPEKDIEEDSFPSTRQGTIAKASKQGAESKFIFDGDLVTIGFSDHSSKPQISELKIDGNVSVIESKSGRATGTKIQGSSFHLSPQRITDEEELYRVFVAGSSSAAASVVGDGLTIEGAEIHLDQLENKLWVNGAGALGIVEDNRKESVDVRWIGGMIFDGTNIYFEQDVYLDASRTLVAIAESSNKIQPDNAKYQLTRSRSQVLNLVLEKPVKLAQLGKSKERTPSHENIEFQEIILIHKLPETKQVFRLANYGDRQSLPVVIEVQSLDAKRQLVDKQRFVAPDARIEPKSGLISAKGPGIISSLRKAAIDSSRSPTPFQSPSARKGDRTQGTLNYLRINFDSGIEANQVENEVKVIGNIRALMQATDDWDLAVDPDQVATLPPGSAKLACDQIRINRWQSRGQETPVTEFLAEGNAHVWGDLFESTASRISYDDARDLLVVEGTSRAPAKLWYQAEAKSSRSHLTARKIWYRPGDQWNRIDDINSASTSIANESKPKRKTDARKSVDSVTGTPPVNREPLSRIRKR